MPTNFFSQERIRQIFFIVLILLLGILLFMELYSFVPAMLGAITLYILMRRWMYHLTEQRKWGSGWAATLLMLLSFIVILLPVGLLANMLTSKISYAISHSTELIAALKKTGEFTGATFSSLKGMYSYSATSIFLSFTSMK